MPDYTIQELTPLLSDHSAERCSRRWGRQWTAACMVVAAVVFSGCLGSVDEERFAPAPEVWGPCNRAGEPCLEDSVCDRLTFAWMGYTYDDAICRPTCEAGERCIGPRGEDIGACPPSGLCYLPCDKPGAYQYDPCVEFLADHPASHWETPDNQEPLCGHYGATEPKCEDGAFGCFGQCTWWCGAGGNECWLPDSE